MSWRSCHPARLRLSLIAIILGPLLVAWDSSGAGDLAISWQDAEAPTPAVAPEVTPPILKGGGGEAASPVAAGAVLTPDQLKAMQPNELGLVPVLRYHVITTNPQEEAQFIRPANMFDVLTLPSGAAPDKDLLADQRQLMQQGFWYRGEPFSITAALRVGANPSVSPASTRWDPLWVPWIQMFDREAEKWFGAFERGEVPLYVSDANPTTITVPTQLPAGLEGDLDGAVLGARGRTVLQYDPASGERATLPQAPVALASRREGLGEGPA